MTATMQTDPRPETPPDDFTRAVWNMVYCMVEAGVDGSEPWWGEDFIHVRKLLEAKGLSTDPGTTGGG